MSSPGYPSAVPPSTAAPSTPAVPDRTPQGDAGRDEPVVRMRTAPRAKARRKAAPLAKAGMIVFAIGLVAIFADMILFASGSRDLPLWVNLTAMLAPLGLGLGLIAVVRENRSASPALAARKAAGPLDR